MVSGIGDDPRAHPDAPVLRGRVAPVRLSILPRLCPIRDRTLRPGGRGARRDRVGLEGTDPRWDRGHGDRRVLGL